MKDRTYPYEQAVYDLSPSDITDLIVELTILRDVAGAILITLPSGDAYSDLEDALYPAWIHDDWRRDIERAALEIIGRRSGMPRA